MKKESPMTPKLKKLAEAAFAQGIVDEDNRRPSPARLRIDSRVRNFYDMARCQRAEQLDPDRKAREAAAAERQRIADEEAAQRVRAAMPRIKAELIRGNGAGAIRIFMNADIGLDT